MLLKCDFWPHFVLAEGKRLFDGTFWTQKVPMIGRFGIETVAPKIGDTIKV
jgi:hypothetical protein